MAAPAFVEVVAEVVDGVQEDVTVVDNVAGGHGDGLIAGAGIVIDIGV